MNYIPWVAIFNFLLSFYKGDNNVWVLGDGKSGQLGLGNNVSSCEQLTKLTNIATILKECQRSGRTPSICLTSSRGALPQINNNNSWNRVDSFHREDSVASVHAGPISSAIITSNIYYLFICKDD